MPEKRKNQERERPPSADAGTGCAAKSEDTKVEERAASRMPTTDPSPVTTPVVSVTIDPREDEEEDYDEGDDYLGRPGAYESTRVFSASIQADGRSVGTVRAMLMDRPNMQGGFYMACDAESAGLNEIGSVLFDHDGLPLYPSLQRVNAHGHPAAGYGGFLYIEHFSEISSAPDNLSEERRRELGTEAIRSLLRLPELTDRWSVAGYICEGCPHPSNRWHREDRKEKPSTVAIRQRMTNDAQQFLCAGFREVNEDERRGMLYITEDMLHEPRLSPAEALAMPLMLTKGAEA